MCQRSAAACQNLPKLIADVRNLALLEACDPAAWATEIARSAARVLRYTERPPDSEQPLPEQTFQRSPL